MLPSYVAALSAVLLLLQAFAQLAPVRRLRDRLTGCKEHPPTAPCVESVEASPVAAGFLADTRASVKSHGGFTLYIFKFARLLGCIAFLVLSVVTFIFEERGGNNLGAPGKTDGRQFPKSSFNPYLSFSDPARVQFSICISAVYALLLAVLAVTSCSRWNRVVSVHLTMVLLVLFGVYAYRDIWPLLTFTEHPVDAGEGPMLWGKLVTLAFGAVIFPVFSPRLYVPFDPKEPSAAPHPEQTASWASMLSYFWVEPIVRLAYGLTHLSADLLPPLSDQDYAANLRKKSFRHLDQFHGAKKRHIFFGLMATFRKEYTLLAATIVLQVLANLAAPVGIKNLLSYLESGGKEAVVRPWVWILGIFLGPVITALSLQWYGFIATRTLVRAEGILTQLIFEHALRIRMKAETEKESQDAAASDATSAPSAPGSTSKPKAKGENLVGKINNLVTSDLGNATEGRDFLMLIFYAPLQAILAMWFLYVILGWSALVGLVIMFATFPLPGMVAKRIQSVQREKMKRTDARVQSVTETVNVLRMVKLFGWESQMDQRLREKREDELVWTWKFKMLDLLNTNINFCIPLFTMLATYATYTLLMKRELSGHTVSEAGQVFDILRNQLRTVFFYVPRIAAARVSLDRIDEFLTETELLDRFESGVEEVHLIGASEESDLIGFTDATFAWSNEGSFDDALTPSKRNFTLKVEGELYFQPGCINLVVGPTGSGKTSLLMALLGEMHWMPSGPGSWFNLPRKGGVAYAAQESWVQSETIKDNILFGAAYDEARYKKVLYQCALEKDLDLFEAGENTEVGEKGLTLSGGQKARVTLARAVYSSAEILLLDDVLAALDVHTSKWIVDKCFAGDLIQGRTVILVTHNIAIASPVAQFVVSLGSNGRIRSQGSISEAISKDEALAAEVAKEQEILKKEVEVIEGQEVKKEDKPSGKLVVSEEISEGHVSWAAFKLYLAALGGAHNLFFWVLFLGLFVINNLANTVQTWFLGYWATQYEDRAASEVNVVYYLICYTVLLLFGTLMFSLAYFVFYSGTMRASRTIHNKLVISVLGATLRWLDTTPTSRVIARCTQDIRAIDGPLASGVAWTIELTMRMLFNLGAVVVITPAFVLPGIVVGLVGAFIGRVYMKAQLSVKREMSNAKSPVLGHFGAAMAGLTSIRAYGAQEAFIKESLARIDRYTRSARMFYNLNRWMSVRVDALGAFFSAALAAYLVYGNEALRAANVGFSLNMAVAFSSLILWWVRFLNEVEVHGTFILERIDHYIKIEQEPKPTERGQPPAYWPASGDVRVENLSARYSPARLSPATFHPLDGPKVLDGLSFHIQSGERVGIVGRTGSGKAMYNITPTQSSLTLSLLRCIFTEGDVYFDGIPTSKINLDALRSNITIIPQIPELLSGNLRGNLDPFEQHDDATMNDALRLAGLFALQDDSEESRLTLDSPISSGGGNLSVGQRQILALARAMLRGSKLLILDEATSAIDYKTDAAIQSSLRNDLNNVTQIIVAHRLQTIMDADKIMVLDAGKLVEFGTPRELLKNDQGVLRALVDESGDKDSLYEMALSARSS
ncbi:hypothetical protein HYDPIDRAFT_94464 [Hydnomerulius pinastri MD-312]|uniref:Unplaced genomic scaffold scaffold_21, whole genome shotgun sequence n=1 Tax=Hydnomerulius pinastri MD-312 TaxID=994086 RepID=A0A0C9WCS5_9AGAM|nr:hypothetical protein HYDPIDRAFT_94464 [Hydnomerulius pinastri MD-312]